jgi:hypothetical protein
MHSEAVVTCPVCLGANNALCFAYATPRDSSGFECQACGRFEVSRSALASYFDTRRSVLSALQRAALSHLLSTAHRGGTGLMITTDWMDRFTRNVRLPSPAEQASNLIRLIGDHLSETGEGYFIDDVTDTARVGAFNPLMFGQLRKELESKGLVQPLDRVEKPNPRGVGVIVGHSYSLTLDGWECYEAERRGRVAGRYGFIAMKFGDPILDAFIERTVKPAVRTGIGFDLVDLRDVSRAGVIDNILREQIRDAAFVLVDLTHDNSGAYWEAGYAEGLGKPVVYLCERTKFDMAKTHFDTNHCTTVLWSADKREALEAEIVATLRRSLNLFVPAEGDRTTS